MASVILVPNSHIDPIWLWRWSEGQQCIRSTFSSAAQLLRNRRDCLFAASSASFYELVEQADPVLFADIKALIKRNQWQIVGGWWVEPDCNIPSGEAMVRQCLYAQRYFKSRFGVRASISFNIDSFGHNAMIPQILAKSGIKYAIFLRPGPHEMKLPGWVFRWRSPDGSEVIAHRIMEVYNASGERIRQLVGKAIGELKPPLSSLLVFVGQGDHGGGPTIGDLEIIDRLRGEVKPVDLKLAPMDEFFRRAERVKGSLPLVEGELQHHASGCYAAVSRVKELNRRVEEALVAAEKYNFMANVLAGTKYHSDEFYRAWTNLLFCQFHDVLAGSCIREAYEGDVFPMMEQSLSIANEVINISMQAVGAKVKVIRDKSIIVFNPHAYPIKAPVEVNWIGREAPRGLCDEKENLVKCQIERGSALTGNSFNLIFVADLPALGYRTYNASTTEPGENLLHRLANERCFADNSVMSVEFDERDGTISRLVMKDGNRTVVNRGARPIVIRDESDTWSHGVFRYDDEVGQFTCERIETIEKGPVRTVVRAKYRYGSSRLRQDFVLYEDLDYLICRVKVDWHERMKMLKLAFPVNVGEPEAIYEIQYGIVKRPTDGEEEPGLRWVDVTGRAGADEVMGATLANDSKYSYDVRGNVIRLTVLRSPVYAHHAPTPLDPEREYEYTDQGEQRFTYVIKPHSGALNPVDAIALADALNFPPLAMIEHRHDGTLPPATSLAKVSGENAVLKVVKRAENANGWIARICETCGRQARIEVGIEPLNLEFNTQLGPHEIKTFLLPDNGEAAREVNLIEEEL